MTEHCPSPAAIKSKRYREGRKRACMPEDVKILLERGRRQRAELERQAKVLRSLAQIEALASLKIIHIQRVQSPAVRARLLGALADWIIECRDTLAAASQITRPQPIRRPRARPVPAWVPADLADVYLDPTISEFEAAALVRQMKREAGA